jgi:hypothetical protein
VLVFLTQLVEVLTPIALVELVALMETMQEAVQAQELMVLVAEAVGVQALAVLAAVAEHKA